MIVWLPLLTNYTKFSNKNVVFLIAFAVAYMYNNYWHTQKNGIPVYPMMNWKSMESHIHVVLGSGLAFGGFYAATGISNAMRKRFHLDGSTGKTKLKGQ